MTSREKFLQAVTDDERDDFISLIQQHTSKKEPFDIEEVLAELSHKQVEEVWSTLQMKTTTTLLSFDAAGDDGEQKEELQQAGTYLQGVVTVAMVTLGLDVEEHPTQLFDTALVLHGILLSIPEELEALQNSIAKLCELYWQKKLVNREDLTSQTFMYLLERSLRPEATGADVKRVYHLCECLENMNLDSDSSTTLRNLLLHTLISNKYLKLEEGIRFFTYLFGLNINFIDQLHKTIKTHIPTSTDSTLAAYGDIYFRAWKVASDNFLEKIEKSCIQDLMYHGVHARRGPRSLASQLRKVLSGVHQQKLHRGVDEMLLRLYEPFMWRSLKVANSDVRANSLCLLIDAFPLQNTHAANEDNDALLQKQFDVFNTLLNDPCHVVRVAAVHGVSLVLKVFWELIPVATIKAFILRLMQDLAWDSAAAEVRAAVIKGIITLLDNPLAHPLLKNILPEIRNLIHDTSEMVRVAFLDLLTKVKGMRAIKFWTIVPMEHLLARLEMDSPPVCRRIVALIINSYLPVEKPTDVQVQRCIVMLQTNQGAARKFYQYAPKHLGLDSTVKLIATLSKFVHSCVKDNQEDCLADSSVAATELSELEESKENQENSPPKATANRRRKVAKDCLESSGSENEREEEEEADRAPPAVTSAGQSDISIEDTDLMAGLMDTMLILWMSIAPDLQETRNKESKRKLQYRFSHVLPVLFRAFRDQRIISSLILLAGFLPPNAVPMVSRSMRSKLKALSTEATVEDYGTMLEAMCKWGKVQEVLELLNEWLEAALKKAAGSGNDTTTSSRQSVGNKSKRRSARVAFQEPMDAKPELALNYLSYLTTHALCRKLVLNSATTTLTEISNTLALSMKCLEKRLQSTEPLSETTSDEFLLNAFQAYLKMEVVLNNTDSNTASSSFQQVLAWADRELLSLLRPAPPSAKRRARPKKQLMGAADATLLANPSGDESMLRASIADHTALFSATLSETLLNDTLLSTTGVKRSAAGVTAGGGGVMEIGVRILQTIVRVSSNMLLVGVGDHDIISQLADFALSIVEIDHSCQHLSQLVSLLYQVTEISLSQGEAEEDGESALIIPSLLTRLLKLLANLAAKRKETAARVLPSIRPPLTEMLIAYYRYFSLRSLSTCDVMASIVSAVITEMTEAIKQDSHFEECSTVSSLPIFSSFLLGMIAKRAVYASLFLSELCCSVTADSCAETRLGVLHVINAVAQENSSASTKSCLMSIQSQLEAYTLPAEEGEDSPLAHMITSSQGLLKKCMTTAGMVA